MTRALRRLLVPWKETNVTDRMRALADEASLDAALAEPRALIYKHSPLCGTSAMAMSEVKGYVEAGGSIPVYVVDVVKHRTIARRIAERLDVIHQSPQVILVENGVAVWKTSHWDITVGAIAAAGGSA